MFLHRYQDRTMIAFKPAFTETNCLFTPTQSPTLTVRQRGDVLLLDALLLHCHFCLCVMPDTVCSSLVQNHTVTSLFTLRNLVLLLYCCLLEIFSLLWFGNSGGGGVVHSPALSHSLTPVLLQFAYLLVLLFLAVDFFFLSQLTNLTIHTVNTFFSGFFFWIDDKFSFSLLGILVIIPHLC